MKIYQHQWLMFSTDCQWMRKSFNSTINGFITNSNSTSARTNKYVTYSIIFLFDTLIPFIIIPSHHVLPSSIASGHWALAGTAHNSYSPCQGFRRIRVKLTVWNSFWVTFSNHLLPTGSQFAAFVSEECSSFIAYCSFLSCRCRCGCHHSVSHFHSNQRSRTSSELLRGRPYPASRHKCTDGQAQTAFGAKRSGVRTAWPKLLTISNVQTLTEMSKDLIAFYHLGHLAGAQDLSQRRRVRPASNEHNYLFEMAWNLCVCR